MALPPVPTSAAPAPLPQSLAWRKLDDLPDPVGLKGMYAGVSDGHVVLAGGSNFPVPLRAGGKKVFHRAVYVRPVSPGNASQWEAAVDALATGLAEGASVTTEHGIVCLGGSGDAGPVADSFVLRWNAERHRLERRALPALPAAVASAAAIDVGESIYVAGGETRQGALAALWRLNLPRALAEPERTRWESLPPWPGRPRFGCILQIITTAAGERLLVAGGMHGPAKSVADYLRDAFLFDPATGRWSRAAEMPRGAVLGGVVKADASILLVLGGSDGHDFERMKELGERYRIPSDILAYDALNDRWATVGSMPLGVVGAGVADLGGGRWLVAGGEYSPGLRTRQVFELHLSRKEGGRDR